MKIRKITREVTVDVIGCENEGCEAYTESHGIMHGLLEAGSPWISIAIKNPVQIVSGHNSHASVKFFCTWACLHFWARDESLRLESDERIIP